MPTKNSYVTCTDMFCGAGGSSIGAVTHGAEVKLAMNHWKLAIESHNANFPNTDHICTDVSACDPRHYPSTDILITSPECTNHSIAKGRKRVRFDRDLFGTELSTAAEDRSRATMWDVPRFAEYHQYRMIIVENVVDAREWVLYDSWLHAMHALGYQHRVVYFNSMFAWPTPQSRDRMYIVLWKGTRAPDLDFHPPAYCPKCDTQVEARQSWKRPDRQYGRYGARGQYVYRCPTCAEIVHPFYYPALTAIDWSLPIQRIGDRKTPLKENTLRRIRLGLERFAGQQLLVELAYAHATNNRSQPATEPWPTQTAQQTLALLSPFLVRHTGAPGDPNSVHPVTDPLGTQVAAGSQHALLSMPPAFLGVQREHSTPRGPEDALQTVVTDNQHFMVQLRNHQDMRDLSDPMTTVTAGGINHGLFAMPILTRHYTNTSEAGLSRGVDEPLGAITSQDHHSLTVPPFLTTYNGNSQAPHPITDPANTVTGTERHALVMPFTASMYGEGKVAAVTDTLGTQIGTQHQGVIMPFIASQYNGPHRNAVHSVAEPMMTVPGMQIHRLAVPGDTPNIEDCGFRMLEPHEIGRAMAFPMQYVVKGNKRERVKQYGNAVTPPVMAMLVERCLRVLD